MVGVLRHEGSHKRHCGAGQNWALSSNQPDGGGKPLLTLSKAWRRYERACEKASWPMDFTSCSNDCTLSSRLLFSCRPCRHAAWHRVSSSLPRRRAGRQ